MHTESKFHINLWPHWQSVYGRSVQSVLHKFRFPFCCLWNTGAWQKTGSYVSGFHSFITDKSLKSEEVTCSPREQRLKYSPGFQTAANSKQNLKAHTFKLHIRNKKADLRTSGSNIPFHSIPSNHNLFNWLMQLRPHLLVGSACVKSKLSEPAPQKNPFFLYLVVEKRQEGEQRGHTAWKAQKCLSRLHPFPVMQRYLPVPLSLESQS